MDCFCSGDKNASFSSSSSSSSAAAAAAAEGGEVGETQ